MAKGNLALSRLDIPGGMERRRCLGIASSRLVPPRRGILNSQPQSRYNGRRNQPACDGRDRALHVLFWPFTGHLRIMENQNLPPPRQRLGSWKEIATFFGRDERTVRRWEKQRGMPIHRLPGGERGGVFAFTDQLSDWQRTRNFPESDSPDANQPEDQPNDVSPAATESGQEIAGICLLYTSRCV